jgi:phage host-nuclease inhibitor protein Gam
VREVNRSIAQMDEVTQQNAALVEEAAAAAEAMQNQAGNLAQVVSVFKLSHHTSVSPVAKTKTPSRVVGNRSPARLR